MKTALELINIPLKKIELKGPLKLYIKKVFHLSDGMQERYSISLGRDA